MTYRWRDRLLLDLPMTAKYHDPTNGYAVNVGTAGPELNAVFGAGAAEPTKLTDRHGYRFDGGDYMQCSAGYQNTTGLISIMVTCMRPLSAGLYCPFGWENIGVDVVGMFLYVNTDDTIRFYCGSSAGLAAAAATTDFGLHAGAISTIGGVYDGTEQILYVNGMRVAVDGTPTAPSSDLSPMIVGARGALSNKWNGDIYHVGMGDFVMSPLQIGDYHISMLQEYNRI